MRAEQIFRGLEQMQYDAAKITGETQLLEGLKKIASNKGFQISGNKGSGNCMFYALSEQLGLVKGIQISHDALRQHIVQYLKENPTLVSKFGFILWLYKSNKAIKWEKLEFLFRVCQNG